VGVGVDSDVTAAAELLTCALTAPNRDAYVPEMLAEPGAPPMTTLPATDATAELLEEKVA
jgi:hypothetical protein